MNIWVLNLLWTGQYPTTPDDSRCGHSDLTKSAVRRPPPPPQDKVLKKFET